MKVSGIMFRVLLQVSCILCWVLLLRVPGITFKVLLNV